ncbi:hypothetical protein LCGC14_0893620 [marine sediment metagenome]|uniref:Uncharacterized protein n=1 Tax=marine sediment metagenome TaxID=412755 RepID=A0A0F9S5E6_9ZZZZ
MKRLTKEELHGMKKQELLKYCKDNNIRVYSNKNKAYIINIISIYHKSGKKPIRKYKEPGQVAIGAYNPYYERIYKPKKNIKFQSEKEIKHIPKNELEVLVRISGGGIKFPIHRWLPYYVKSSKSYRAGTDIYSSTWLTYFLDKETSGTITSEIYIDGSQYKEQKQLHESKAMFLKIRETSEGNFVYIKLRRVKINEMKSEGLGIKGVI